MPAQTSTYPRMAYQPYYYRPVYVPPTSTVTAVESRQNDIKSIADAVKDVEQPGKTGSTSNTSVKSPKENNDKKKDKKSKQKADKVIEEKIESLDVQKEVIESKTNVSRPGNDAAENGQNAEQVEQKIEEKIEKQSEAIEVVTTNEKEKDIPVDAAVEMSGAKKTKKNQRKKKNRSDQVESAAEEITEKNVEKVVEAESKIEKVKELEQEPAEVNVDNVPDVNNVQNEEITSVEVKTTEVKVDQVKTDEVKTSEKTDEKKADPVEATNSKPTVVKPVEYIWTGRTKAQVDEDNLKIAMRNGVYAYCPIKPVCAFPDQLFWVVEVNGQTTLRTFKYIDQHIEPGKWERDARYGNAYFVVDKPSICVDKAE